jgi:hypothetical protein
MESEARGGGCLLLRLQPWGEGEESGPGSGRSSGQSVSPEVDGVTGGIADVAGVGAWVKVALQARIIRVGRGYPGVGCDSPSKPPD